MLLKRIYDPKLAQASYLIGCQATGEALVVDANRDVAQYIAAAAEEGLRVTHVTETHIHADFVSGSRELAQRTGAQLLLSDEGDADWKYAFAAEANATLLHDHDVFMVGNLKFEVLHTPGHTPEHLSFLVTDTPASAGPIGALTGDFVFVGDVGRPDLLERAAKIMGTMEAGARTLFRSLQRFKQLPDHLQIWPGHGAGSACGKALGAVPMSTLGYEKIANWGLTMTDEQAFVDAVLAGQPEPPKYFAEMKRINKQGPALLGELRSPPRVSLSTLTNAIATGAIVVDCRPAAAFADGFIPGTINIPLNKSFNTWAGWLLPYDRDVHLVTEDEPSALSAVRDLAMIGLDRIVGYAAVDVVAEFSATGGVLRTMLQRNASSVATDLAAGQARVVDVRGATEYAAGHLPGVVNIPLGYLTEHLDELPTATPLVLHCQGGGRSAIAASVLSARGFTNVINMTGGYAAWVAEGLPVEHEMLAQSGAHQ